MIAFYSCNICQIWKLASIFGAKPGPCVRTCSWEPRIFMVSTFVVNGGTGSWHNDNIRCHQLRQSWHHDDTRCSHYSDVTWAPSPQWIRENIKAPCCWPLVRGILRWIPLTRGQQHRKLFQVLTSSCITLYSPISTPTYQWRLHYEVFHPVSPLVYHSPFPVCSLY